MKHGNEIKLALLILPISIITVNFGISGVNAIWPFDQFMTPTSNQTSNQSSASSLTNESKEEEYDESEGEEKDD